MKALIERYFLALLSILLIVFSIIFHHYSYRKFLKEGSIENKSCVAVGVIDDIELKNGKYRYVLKNVNLKYGNKNKKFKKIMATGLTGERIKCGSKLMIKGKLNSFKPNTNFGEFNYKLYNFNHNIYYEIKNCKLCQCSNNYNHIKEFFYNIKSDISEKLTLADSSNNKITSSFIKTIVLSQKQDMDMEIKALYQRNGVSHILSISGLHIWIIGYGAYIVFNRFFGVKISCIFGGLFLSFYMLLIGFGISSFRAYIMLILLFVSRLIKRVYSASRALAFASILTLSINPKYVFDAGFLLSYGAVTSILIIMPVVRSVFKNKHLLKSGIFLTFSIQLGLMPVTAYLFYEQSTYSIFLNIIIIPMMLPLLSIGILASVFSLISFPITVILLKISSVIIGLFTFICRLADRLYFSHIVFGRPAIITIFIYYLVLILSLIYIKFFRHKKKMLFAGTFLLIFILSFHNRSKLVITVLDVGQGDGIVIEIPHSNKVYLIDGGSTSKTDGAALSITSFLKSRGYSKIDVHILTHSDIDHLLGIKNMISDNFKVNRAVLPKINDKDENYLKFESFLNENKIKRLYIKRGDKISVNNLNFECLHPNTDFIAENANAYSTVLYLKYRDFDMLFTGDLEKNGESEIMKNKLPKLDVLKVAHHGSKNSTDNSFLDKTEPKIALISCGYKNIYGHPHKELLDRLKFNKIVTYRTDINGSIMIKTDGLKHLSVDYPLKYDY